MRLRKKAITGALRFLNGTGLGHLVSPITQGCGAVFMMHHVRPPRTDAFQPNSHLEISPEFLRVAVERIRANGYEIVALDEAVDLLKSGYGRNRYAVLTLDDGYRDNIEVAYPILKEMKAPFTIFAATGLIDRESELWWIALERIIAENDEIVFSEDGAYSGIASSTTEEKLQCFQRIVDHITLEVDERDQRAIVRALAARYGLDLKSLADRYMMTWDELRTLAADPLVTIGAHTHDHFALARLDANSARADVLKGMRRHEEELGQRPKHFAYPYGKPHAVGVRDASIIREYGFASAVTTSPGILQSASARDTALLPRVSLNGDFQDPAIVDQFLTGAPFAFYWAMRWLTSGFGIKSGFSRLFPSTK